MRDAAITSSSSLPGNVGERSSRRAPRPEPRFRRRLRGYDRAAVDSWAEALEGSRDELEIEVAALREELQGSTEHATELSHDLSRARAELRYWNDRSTYIESEVARARRTAAELEQTARERAEKVELDAQERSLQLIDRVCDEANALLVHAREESREMFLRFETEVDMSQQKLDRLDAMRREVATSMQDALTTFEDAVRELDKVAPAKRMALQTEQLERRAGRTTGQDRTAQAARRFLQQREALTTAALSTPLPRVLSASVFDADERTKAAASPAMDESETLAALAGQPLS